MKERQKELEAESAELGFTELHHCTASPIPPHQCRQQHGNHTENKPTSKYSNPLTIYYIAHPKYLNQSTAPFTHKPSTTLNLPHTTDQIQNPNP
jgi:hypothetical protein